MRMLELIACCRWADMGPPESLALHGRIIDLMAKVQAHKVVDKYLDQKSGHFEVMRIV